MNSAGKKPCTDISNKKIDDNPSSVFAVGPKPRRPVTPRWRTPLARHRIRRESVADVRRRRTAETRTAGTVCNPVWPCDEGSLRSVYVSRSGENPRLRIVVDRLLRAQWWKRTIVLCERIHPTVRGVFFFFSTFFFSPPVMKTKYTYANVSACLGHRRLLLYTYLFGKIDNTTAERTPSESVPKPRSSTGH